MRRAEDHFDEGADRLAHIRRVLQTAREIEARHPFDGRLVAAALYHDLGYAPDLAVTGYHPIDGAMLARADGLDAEIVDAVLHHSGAWLLAQRTRPELAAEHYGPACRMMDTPLSRALTFCDNRSGPRGERFTLAQRVAEIRVRHARNTALMAALDVTLPALEEIDAEFLPLLG